MNGKAPTSHASSASTYGVGTSSSYGHLKLANNLTTTTASGYALNAAQGKALKDLIDAITPTPPTLTSVTADGTAIGADGWTGTGWFCTAADTKYVANDAVDNRIDGFNRFCLKPAADNGEWQNWTPYFDLNGTAYEFFYAPGRALYEALIPSNTQTAAQIVAAIRWENHPPTSLMYGKLTNICGVYNKDCLEFSDTDDTIARYWIKDPSEFRNTTDRIMRDEKAVFYGIFMGHYDFSSLDITYLSLLYLSGDLDGDANINLNEAAQITRHINGAQAQFGIQTIDNF